MAYFTADSYKDMERVNEFEKNGKMYATVRCNCDRCGGTGYFAIAVHNNAPVLSPHDGGMCYSCNGSGIFTKEVRLYTEKEYNRMNAEKEKRKVKKDAEIQAGAEKKRDEWLQKNGFNENGDTYVLLGDSYSIKDELKAAGWRFDKVLKWHKADPGKYEDRCFKVWHGNIMEFDLFGHQWYNDSAEKLVTEKNDEYFASHNTSNSEWIGEEKERIRDIDVIVKGLSGFDGAYGWTNIITFEDAAGNIITWFTAKDCNIAIGDQISLTGTVKSHTTYRGVKQTQMTRCILK